MTGINCDLFTHNQSRSYLNHLVYNKYDINNYIFMKCNKNTNESHTKSHGHCEIVNKYCVISKCTLTPQ
jgi:hypothetical protein